MLATGITNDTVLPKTNKDDLRITEFNCQWDDKATFCVAVARDSKRGSRIFCVRFYEFNWIIFIETLVNLQGVSLSSSYASYVPSLFDRE